jgi:hypothetical protein
VATRGRYLSPAKWLGPADCEPRCLLVAFAAEEKSAARSALIPFPQGSRGPWRQPKLPTIVIMLLGGRESTSPVTMFAMKVPRDAGGYPVSKLKAAESPFTVRAEVVRVCLVQMIDFHHRTLPAA